MLVDVENWDGEGDGENAKFTAGSDKPRALPDAPSNLTKACRQTELTARQGIIDPNARDATVTSGGVTVNEGVRSQGESSAIRNSDGATSVPQTRSAPPWSPRLALRDRSRQLHDW